MGTTMAHSLVVAVCLYAHQVSASSPVTLSDGLQSLVVTQISKDGNVTYTPARLSLDDPGSYQVTKLNNTDAIISARLSLVADTRDVDELERRVKATYGDAARITKGKPRTFGIWLFVDGREVFSRPVAAGQIDRIPVQFQASLTDDEESKVVTSACVLTWIELTPPLDVRIRLNWKMLSEYIERQVNRNTTVSSASVESSIRSLIASGIISIEGKTGEGPIAEDALAPVVDAIVSRVHKEILEGPVVRKETRPASQPGDDGLGISYRIEYRLKSGLHLRDEQVELDSSTTRAIERTTLIRGNITTLP